MFEIEWKKEKSVYRNLLQIKGISKTLANNISYTLGIAKDTKYGSLESQKVEELNLLISNFKKKTTPFTLLRNPNIKGNTSLGINSINTQVLENSTSTSQSSGVNSSEASKAIAPLNTILYNPILSSLDTYQKDNIKMLISSGTLRGKRLKLGFQLEVKEQDLMVERLKN